MSKSAEQPPDAVDALELLPALAGHPHELPPPVPGAGDTAVRGRAGSQTWRLLGLNSRASFGTTSQTSQSWVKPRSVTVLPRCSRTKLLAPSQPTTQRADRTCGPSGPSTVTSTRSSCSVSAVTAYGRSTVTPGSSVPRSASTASRPGW